MYKMREIIFIEICSNTEIRFLRHGDYEYQIEGEKNVEKFMQSLSHYALFDDDEKDYLDSYGLEEFNREYDFKDILNLLDRTDINVLKKHSQLIN